MYCYCLILSSPFKNLFSYIRLYPCVSYTFCVFQPFIFPWFILDIFFQPILKISNSFSTPVYNVLLYLSIDFLIKDVFFNSSGISIGFFFSFHFAAKTLYCVFLTILSFLKSSSKYLLSVSPICLFLLFVFFSWFFIKLTFDMPVLILKNCIHSLSLWMLSFP